MEWGVCYEMLIRHFYIQSDCAGFFTNGTPNERGHKIKTKKDNSVHNEHLIQLVSRVQNFII